MKPGKKVPAHLIDVPLVTIWVCDGCGGKWHATIAKQRGKCPSCGNPDGQLVEFTPEELQHG